MEALRAIDEKDQIVSSLVLDQRTEGTVSTYAGGTKQVFSENRARFEAYLMCIILAGRIATLSCLV